MDHLKSSITCRIYVVYETYVNIEYIVNILFPVNDSYETRIIKVNKIKQYPSINLDSV